MIAAHRGSETCAPPSPRSRSETSCAGLPSDICAIAEGAKEIVLLGQNVDDYHDPDGHGGLAALVREVQLIAGLKRLRFMTSHPQDLESAHPAQ